MTDTLIVHHRYTSSYSEKVRLMLGYTKATWQSVPATFYPPRPSIDPLVGGYRRIPVAQVGADVFCDSRIICEEIAHITNKPELSAATQPLPVREFMEDVESRIFYHVLSSVPVVGAMKVMARKVPVRHWFSYLKDKKHILKTTPVALPPREGALSVWQAHLRDLDERLADGDYLFGADHPTIADFTAVHLIWWRLDMDGKSMLAGLERLNAWYGRMVALGHGNMIRINAAKALETAENSTPRPIPAAMTQNPLTGSQVEIRPTETMPVPTRGVLAGADDTRWVLARESDAGSTVHVHFPRVRFQLIPQT
jgi:glutathione S-transferase